MRILLVGFSVKNAAVFAVFCKRNLSNVQCESVERQFGDSLRLVLPKLNLSQSSCDAYVIELDGVGLNDCNENSLLALSQFIGDKPVLLIKKRNIDDCKKFAALVSNTVTYMKSPYSKEEAEKAINTLKYAVEHPSNTHSIKHNPANMKLSSMGTKNSDSSTDNNTDSKQANTAKPLKPSTAAIQQPSIDSIIQSNPATQILDTILQQYFNIIYDTMFVKNILAILSYRSPLQVMIGSSSLLINPAERSVIIDDDVEKLLDFFAITGRRTYHPKTNKINFSTLTVEQYHNISIKMMHAKATKHTLMTILWQIAEEVISANELTIHFPLPVKVKYIPNFSVMRFVPHYTPSVLSACLAKPKTITELQALFPELTYEQLNRVILIAMLSGIIDAESLSQYQKQANTSTAKSDTPTHKNKENKKSTKKSGFLKRLLKKLAG